MVIGDLRLSIGATAGTHIVDRGVITLVSSDDIMKTKRDISLI